MKKVVINKCYGGFSLSPLAVKRYAEIKGIPCYFFSGNDEPINIEDICYHYWVAYTVSNPKEIFGDTFDWRSLTQEQLAECNKKQDEVSINNRPENREDPILIQVIKELGEKANGQYAELKIVEIPDDIEYQIEEYDGIEHIAEKHRIWG